MIILPAGATDPNNPRIGWRNFIAPGMVTASSAADGFGASNLTNPATYLKWRATDTAAQTIVVDAGADVTVDYLGIARHNFGSQSISYTLASSPDNTTWTDVATAAPDDDAPIIHAFVAATARYWRLSLTSGNAAATIGVMYLGEMLTLSRRIFVGHTPITYGRRRSISTGMSENGEFMGRVKRSETLETSVSMANIDGAFYRSAIDAFFEASAVTPFFWAWRPEDYELEVGFAWVVGEPSMSNQRANGMIQIEFAMQAIA